MSSITIVPKKTLTVAGILNIIQLLLKLLTAVPVVGPDAELASILIDLYQKSVAAYELASGLPFDVTRIPLEEKV